MIGAPSPPSRALVRAVPQATIHARDRARRDPVRQRRFARGRQAIVLDTKVISEAMKPEANPAVRAWLNEQVAETLYLTAASSSRHVTRRPARPAGSGLSIRGKAERGTARISTRRHTDRLEPRMCAAGTRLQAIEPGTDVVAGQVQHLAPEPPVLLDLRLGFR